MFSRFYLDPVHDENRAVLLVGGGRTGTTWVAEVLNHRHPYRLIFEPFHTRIRKYLRSDARFDLFLDPDAEFPSEQAVARRVFQGRIRAPQVDAHNRRFWATRRLIKDVSCSFSLPWMRRAFPELSIVLLVRHPLATARSRMQAGWKDWLDQTLAQEELRELLPSEFQAPGYDAGFPLLRHLTQCCIELYIPLSLLGPGQLHVCSYEQCVMNPAVAFSELFDYLGQPYSPAVLEATKGWSLTTNKARAVGPRVEAELVDPSLGEAPASALEILRLFKIDRLYRDDGSPRAWGDAALRVFQAVDSVG